MLWALSDVGGSDGGGGGVRHELLYFSGLDGILAFIPYFIPY